MTKKKLEQKKEYARLLYMKGEEQKVIAAAIEVSAVTVSKWAVQGKWREKRAASNVTRPELINKILIAVNNTIDKFNESNDPSTYKKLSDDLVKFSKTIENLDKKASVVDVIEVFTDFIKWLQQRSEYDSDVTVTLIKSVNAMQNKYVSEKIEN